MKQLLLSIIFILKMYSTFSQSKLRQLEIEPFLHWDFYPKFTNAINSISTFKLSIKGIGWGVNTTCKHEKVKYVLYDINRTQAVKAWIFDNNQNQQKLNVQGIKSGQYILVVTKGRYRQSRKIIIR